MAGQCGLKLAISLITAHFGDLVAKVCSCLLHRGTLTLQEIIRFTELSSSQVKNCLLVLIQHNCVQAFSTPRPAGPGSVAKAVTQYMALFDSILHRMRFAKFLAVVRDDLGPQCEILLAGLLQNGRLTFGQLVERATSNKPEVSASMREGLRANFNRLVSARYVECCPRPEPFIDPSPQEETRSTRRRSAKISFNMMILYDVLLFGDSLQFLSCTCNQRHVPFKWVNFYEYLFMTVEIKSICILLDAKSV